MIINDILQSSSTITTFSDNKHNIKLNKVVMLTPIDTDYNNPDVKKCCKIVLDDFSNKILTLFREKQFKVGDVSQYNIYDISKRWVYTVFDSYEHKEILSLANGGYENNISNYISKYINDYFKINTLEDKLPSINDISHWCGGGEFPFIEICLIKNNDNILLCYYLSR